ncbi:Zinc finger, SWIM-type [Sesbania bispinosa]|nr:Zinc finger, SWIM-type [Sesbania bispinosa]
MDEVDGHMSDTESTMYTEDQSQFTNEENVSYEESGEEGVPLHDAGVGGEDCDREYSGGGDGSGDKYRIDGGEDIRKVDMIRLSEDEFKLYHFTSRLVAFQFYNKYAQKRGFAARGWNTVVNKEGGVSQQTFVCFREGYRLKKHLNKENRKREARPLTRCGCFAFLKVRFARDVSLWIVKDFSDEHCHELLPRKYDGMLSSHRKMNETDIMQMNTMRDVGIGVTQIYGLVANQSGGYKNVGYRKSDMYNAIMKERRSEGSDARAALSYLRALGRNDKDMYWSHTVDEEGRLKHLFWTDGRSQGDYEVGRFRTKWEEMICEFGLESNEWVRELYEKRKLWVTAHIRESFFAGFRTTSRQKELEADFESINGDPVLQTPFVDIEAAAAKLYTRKVFMKFRVMLWRASKMKVSGCERTPSCHIYIVSYRSGPTREWHVSYVAENEEVKCCCQRMESMGIPCEHIVVLLHYLDVKELLKSLILDRWTKYAKQSVDGIDVGYTNSRGSIWKSEVMSLLFDCYELCRLAGKRIDKLEETRGVIRNHMQSLKESNEDGNNEDFNYGAGRDNNLRDPARVRTKGCGSRQSAGGSRGNRRTTTCSVCQGRGHNKQTCHLRAREAPLETIATAGSRDERNE